ncbi:MAG: PD-(D/E)XK nuclease family protein [Bacilli bacterium]|nr:PD-(D/E)XK nuclease family protein [Bacilli bacterium]MBN2877223.1 PD-(D/E)XK nuclease family protein [Bacilli bacterium]
MEIDKQAIFLCDHQAKSDLLKEWSDKSLFFDVVYLDPTHLFGSLSNRYLFWMKERYGYSMDHSKQMIPYWDYLDVNRTYQSQRLNELTKVKHDLIDSKIYQPLHSSVFGKRTVYTVDFMPSPGHLLEKATTYELDHKSDNSVTIVEAKNDLEAAYAVYQTIVSLLEQDIDINDIVVLNATKQDLYHLDKWLTDSNIPYQSNHPRSLSEHPEVLSILRKLGTISFAEILDEIETLQEDLRDSVLQILNSYMDQDLRNHPDIFASLLKESNLKEPHDTNCIQFLSMDDLRYDTKKQILVMNYRLDGFVDYLTNTSYLNETELEEIGYPSLDDINQYKEAKRQRFLDTVTHLTLFFSEYSDHEHIASDLLPNRPITRKTYEFRMTGDSYLNTLGGLEHAKAKYDYNTYYLKRNDFDLLEATYGKEYRIHDHAFTGIYPYDLQDLLKKHNTLTGAKIESYHLCQFQYLLKYLLKLGTSEPTANQVLGTLTHKVFEQTLKSEDFDLEDIVMNEFDFPETESYKEPLYRKALLQELRQVLPILVEFHKQTKYNQIETEIEFKIPYQDFFITGTIDKAMIFPTTKDKSYFVLVDYKMSDKEFKLEEFQAGRMLQLPLYLFAFMTLHPNSKPTGIYYQTTSIGRYKKEPKAITNSFQMKGISIDSPAKILAFDEDLSHIRSVSLNKDNSFSKNSKVYQEQELMQMKGMMESQISEMIENLRSGKFAINPLPTYGKKKDSISCEYCEFRSICYNKNHNLGGVEE